MIISNLLNTNITCNKDLEINNLISECKLNKNIKNLEKYIIQYSKEKGFYDKLIKWQNKYDINTLEERCKWFNCRYDIDNFLKKI